MLSIYFAYYSSSLVFNDTISLSVIIIPLIITAIPEVIALIPKSIITQNFIFIAVNFYSLNSLKVQKNQNTTTRNAKESLQILTNVKNRGG